MKLIEFEVNFIAVWKRLGLTETRYPLKSSGENFNLPEDLSWHICPGIALNQTEWWLEQGRVVTFSPDLFKTGFKLCWESLIMFETLCEALKGQIVNQPVLLLIWTWLQGCGDYQTNARSVILNIFKTLIKLHTKWRWYFKNAVITLTHWVHTHAWRCPIEQLYCWSLALKALLRGPSGVVTREEQVFHSL